MTESEMCVRSAIHGSINAVALDLDFDPKKFEDALVDDIVDAVRSFSYGPAFGEFAQSDKPQVPLSVMLGSLRSAYGTLAGWRATQLLGKTPDEADIYVIAHPKLKQAFAGLYSECLKILTSDNPEIPTVVAPDWGKISMVFVQQADESRKRALSQYAEVLRRAEEADKRATAAEAALNKFWWNRLRRWWRT